MEKKNLKIYIAKYKNNFMRDTMVMAENETEAIKVAIGEYRKHNAVTLSNRDTIESIELAGNQDIYGGTTSSPISEYKDVPVCNIDGNEEEI